jgi:hypothetical protein
MTYTFKLARRLAVSRNFAMLPLLLVLAACGGETTAPEAPTEQPTSGTATKGQDLIPVALRVSPQDVTLETNQLIQFRAHGRTSAGDSVGAAVTWSTSGGTILPDGRFSAAAIGTYTVIGENRVRGKLQLDSTLVTVVRRNTKLVSVEISPTGVTLNPGVSQRFTAVGRLKDGSVAPIGVNWSATGGSIDGGGTYVAGDTAGTYRVTASNTTGTLADTVTVTISAPPAPPPPDSTPTEPVLAKVVLRPASVTLAPGTKKQLTWFGRTTTGDSVAVDVQFKATGGTITSGGLYTAGSTPGLFQVIASSDALSDTTAITITAPLGSGTPTGGIPFGPFGAWSGATLNPYTDLFNFSLGSVSASVLIDRINAARANHVKLLTAMTGGDHDNYKSVIDGVYQFDMGKWKAKMDTYNTPEMKTAVAAAVLDGTLVGNIVMDEPSNTSPDNTWGPAGTLNKARVDSMAEYARAIFPTLPMGVTMDYTIWSDQSYKKLDFIVSQYRWFKGDVYAYRDGALRLAARDGHQVVFSLNILDGGYRIDGCPIPQTGGPGTYGTNCRMTPQQVRDYGMVLGPAGCGLVMWHYAPDFMADLENRAAFKDIADKLATLPAKSCRK